MGVGVLWLVIIAAPRLSNSITNGGNIAGPLWLRILSPVALLTVAIPSAVLGFRSRTADRSVLGSAMLLFAVVMSVWAALTGIFGFFI